MLVEGEESANKLLCQIQPFSFTELPVVWLTRPWPEVKVALQRHDLISWILVTRFSVMQFLVSYPKISLLDMYLKTLITIPKDLWEVQN